MAKISKMIEELQNVVNLSILRKVSAGNPHEYTAIISYVEDDSLPPKTEDHRSFSEELRDGFITDTIKRLYDAYVLKTRRG